MRFLFNDKIKNFVNNMRNNKFTNEKICADNIILKYPYVNKEEWEYIRKLSQQVLKLTGGVVYSGPFAEMKLVPNSFLTTRPLWVIGCYEQEIETALCDLITNPPANVVDIGSAHGYYMVGLATQISKIEVIGFEAEEYPHWNEAKLLAELNNVSDRIVQKGFCNSDALNATLKDGSAIIIDCEGAEFELLNPIKSPTLKTCRIICELHDFYKPGITRELISRFHETHFIELINEKIRDPLQFRILDSFTTAQKNLCVKESKHISHRLTSGRFLWMTPRLK